MNENEFNKYLEDRYYPQIEWYSDRSTWNKRVYWLIQWLLIILSALTPALILLAGEWSRWPAIVVAVLVAVGTGSLKTFKYQENWTSYRTTAEILKKEIHLYRAGVGDYSGVEDREALFVERVESWISRENTFWLATKGRSNEIHK